MPQLPIGVWIGVAGAVLLLLALCVGTTYAIVRASARRRVAQWPAWRLLALVGAAMVPWLFVSFAPIRLEVAIHGVGPLLAWLLAALLAFALLVLLPLVALLCVTVWGIARRRRGSVPPSERESL